MDNTLTDKNLDLLKEKIMSIIFDPNQAQDEATKRDMEKVKKILKEDGTTIFYRASPEFINLLVANEHPNVQAMPAPFKEVLIKGEGIKIQKRMMLDWIEKKLDDRNAFVLANGIISLVQDKNVSL